MMMIDLQYSPCWQFGEKVIAVAWMELAVFFSALHSGDEHVW